MEIKPIGPGYVSPFINSPITLLLAQARPKAFCVSCTPRLPDSPRALTRVEVKDNTRGGDVTHMTYPEFVTTAQRVASESPDKYAYKEVRHKSLFRAETHLFKQDTNLLFTSFNKGNNSNSSYEKSYTVIAMRVFCFHYF